MSWFIENAWAESPAPATAGNGWTMDLVFLGVMFAMIFFFIIWPQMKRAKTHRQMIEGLSKNDEVVTSGGLAGKITVVDNSFITMEIADGVTVKIQKSAVATVLPKGTLKG